MGAELANGVKRRKPFGWPAWLCSALGRWRRRRGRYDRFTLTCFRTAWLRRPSHRHLLAWLRFRRDLGRVPPVRHLRSLAAAMPDCSPAERRLLVNWLNESGEGAVLAGLPSSMLRDLSEQSPPAAAELERRGHSLSEAAGALARMRREQGEWRRAFADYLHRRKGSICVVGNAPTLEDARLGREIDAHEAVFRFNCFSDPQAGAAEVTEGDSVAPVGDTGRRVDVWVRAPDLRPLYPSQAVHAGWVVLTGPDARYHQARWGHLLPLLQAGKPILTVPLGVWRGLVRELQAPPSAGVLCLAWLMTILGGAEGLTAAGFQRGSSRQGRYHYALHRHRPSRRHNWEAERALLRRWEAQGLRFLD